jgi:hypothetical protein
MAGPAIPKQTWHSLLTQYGFSGIDNAFPLIEDDTCSTMISAACEEISARRPMVIETIHLLITKESSVQLEMAKMLINAVQKESPSFICDIIALPFAADSSPGNFDQNICVSLLDVRNSFLYQIDEPSFLFLQ